MKSRDVIIVGAGAAGLSAAKVLKKYGIEDILVLERESEVGGLPRHSHHPGFGFSQFGIPYFGPSYVRRLLRECKDVPIQRQTTVCQLNPGGELTIANQNGMTTIKAEAVLITTGIRESSGVSQLIRSQRPWGFVFNWSRSAVLAFQSAAAISSSNYHRFRMGVLFRCANIEESQAKTCCDCGRASEFNYTFLGRKSKLTRAQNSYF